MKAKKGAKGPPKKAKAKRQTATVAPGTGFGKTADGESDANRSIVPEAASGAEGDATPHRAAVTNVQTLEDPRKAIPTKEEVATDGLVLDVEEAKALRFGWDLSLDALIEKFEDARQMGDFDKVVAANRHLVTELLLYRFTSAILNVEGDKTRETREEESRNMRELRRMLIAVCWEIDIPFKKAVLRAEERLMTVLQSQDVSGYTERNAGNTALDVGAFWVVIYAAISAWEERGKQNDALENVDMQNSLSAAASACRSSPRVSDLVNPSLKVLEGVLSSADPSAQAELVKAADEESIVQLAAMVEQVRLLPTNAYGGLRQRMQSILDFILSDRYNVTPPGLRPIRFQTPDVERGSALASFKQSDAVRR